MTFYWIRVGLNPTTGVLRRGEAQTCREKCPVTMEAAIRVRQVQPGDSKHWRQPQKPGERLGIGLSLGASGGNKAVAPLILDV